MVVGNGRPQQLTAEALGIGRSEPLTIVDPGPQALIGIRVTRVRFRLFRRSKQPVELTLIDTSGAASVR